MAYRTDFTGLTDTYLDTAAYNLDPAFQNIFLRDAKEIDQRRFNGYRYYMDFYKGRMWNEQGEWSPAYMNQANYVEEEFVRRSRQLPTILVDKLVSFSVKEPWTIKLSQELEEAYQADNNPIYDLLEAVWRANTREEFSYDLLYMGCIMGDVFVKVSYDEDFYAEGIGELKFDILDSRTVLPMFDGQDRKKMIGARIQYPFYELRADGSRQKRMYREVHTDGNIVTLIDNDIQSVAPNPLGELMIVHIPNEPLPFERFGRSDLEILIKPAQEYNEKTSDFSEILAYHAAPVTIIKGARSQGLEKGARKIWGGIPKDGAVENLELTSDLSSSLEYLDRLEQFMHKAMGVPIESMGQKQEISNTSGAALHVQYQPLLERVEKKQVHYGKGLRRLNGIILKFYEAVGLIELPDIHPALKYQTIIEWGDALPRDRSIDLQDIATEMGLEIESRRGALKRLGEENPEAKIEEIDEEKIAQAERDFMTGGLAGFGDPAAGPEGLGTEPAANEGPQKDVSGATQAVKRSNSSPAGQGNQVSLQAVKKSAQTSTAQNKSRGRPQRP